jgi:hypothetical protein
MRARTGWVLAALALSLVALAITVFVSNGVLTGGLVYGGF